MKRIIQAIARKEISLFLYRGLFDYFSEFTRDWLILKALSFIV